jgi:hypothetical protein
MDAVRASGVACSGVMKVICFPFGDQAGHWSSSALLVTGR